MELIPNGADPEMFASADLGKSFREEHLLENSFVALYAGAHGMSNDLGVVLDAAKILQATPAIKIVFLGDGKEKPALQTKAEGLGLTNVLFLPPAPKNEMAEALAGADACLAILKPLEEYKSTYPNKVFVTHHITSAHLNDGDVDVYTMNPDGSGVKRITRSELFAAIHTSPVGR